MKRPATFFMFFAAASAIAAHLPDLYPPRDTIGPSFWEQYQYHIFGGVALLTCLVVFLCWFLRRPTVVICIPADIIARQSLEKLSGRAENGMLAGQVSRVVRNYLPNVLALPSGELTADEVAASLKNGKYIGEILTSEIVRLLRDCDILKYGPTPKEALNLVVRASNLVNSIEVWKKETACQAQSEESIEGKNSRHT